MVFGVTSPQGEGSVGGGGPASRAATTALAGPWARVSESQSWRRCVLDPETRGRSLHLCVVTLSACNSPPCKSVTRGWRDSFITLFLNI